MGVRWEAGNLGPVVHAPTIPTGKVHTDVPPFERHSWTHATIAVGIGVIVVNAEQEGVSGLPGTSVRQSLDPLDGGRSL
jgi:hypothetical protein